MPRAIECRIVIVSDPPRNNSHRAGREGDSHSVKRLLAVVLSGVAVLASCGGSSKPASRAAKQYLAIIAPANQAIDVFEAGLKALPSSATTATYVKITAPLAAAFSTVDQKLLRDSWPANARTDIRALMVADSVVIADLGRAATMKPVTFNAWERQLSKDLGKILPQAELVRTDLGLPLHK